MHHGEAVSRGQGGLRAGCANTHSVVVGAPIPLANGPVRAMTTPYHGGTAPTMDLTLYCARRDDDNSLSIMPSSIEGSTSSVSITLTYAGYAHALNVARQSNAADF
ncbi:MAG TPA: hypothetical protein VN837_05960 [Chloroflexota bacterium]|nr:hypothetical protein [Chloroflexota bacterium]